MQSGAAPARAARRGAAARQPPARAREPRLLAFLLIVAVVGFASDPVNTESPAFAHAFGRPDTDAGFFIGAFGVGAVAAAFLVAGRVAGSRGRMSSRSSLLGGGMVAYSLVPWLPLALRASSPSPASAISPRTRPRRAGSSSRSRSHQRGRIMALWSVAFLGLRPIASLADGAIAGAFGVRAAGVVLAVPALAIAGGHLLLTPP